MTDTVLTKSLIEQTFSEIKRISGASRHGTECSQMAVFSSIDTSVFLMSGPVRDELYLLRTTMRQPILLTVRQDNERIRKLVSVQRDQVSFLSSFIPEDEAPDDALHKIDISMY